eukprot:scaffold31724_cov60-Cyclotella_meneghiniana.AAC.5
MEIDEDVEYGLRRSADSTSYEYRDSSSLSPAQFIEQEVYYAVSRHILQQCIIIAHLIIPVLTTYIHYRQLLRRYEAIATVTIQTTVQAVRHKLNHAKTTLENLQFLLRWTLSFGELALLYAEDLTVFVRRHHRFPPKRHRRLSEINRHDCYVWFGLAPEQLRQLLHHLRIPNQCRGNNSAHVFGGEECFIISLYHMIKGAPFTEMSRTVFGGDPRYFSTMFDIMIDHLYLTFYNKISGTSLSQWIPRHLHRCRQLIHDALNSSALYETEYLNGQAVNETFVYHDFDFDTFRLFGFFDDFGFPCGRPAAAASRRENFLHDIQRAFYSGYHRLHGMKAQVVYLPIGIIGSVFITELRHNDNGVQNMSGLNNYLVELFIGAGILIGGLYPCLYCDGIFAVLATILPRFLNPTHEQHLVNIRLSSLRVVIEHVFGDHRMRFKLFHVPARLRLFTDGVKVRRLCLVSFFILNCYNCLIGTRCRYFGQIPPTLAEYLPLDEVLVPPPAVNLGDVWDYGPLDD